MCKLFQLFIVLLLVPALPVLAEVNGEITEYGYYKMTTDPKRYRNISSTSGFVQEGGKPELVEKTDQVPLELKRLFGFKFRISGFESKRSVQLKLVVSHPKITRPNGSTSTGYSYPLVFDVEEGVIENESGYSIDHEFEMVEGEWKFEYWYNNDKLLSQTFNTYMKQDAGEAEPADSTDKKESAAAVGSNADGNESAAEVEHTDNTVKKDSANEAESTSVIKPEQNSDKEQSESNKADNS